jgi:hypothetical protein
MTFFCVLTAKTCCYVGGFTWKPDLIADSHMRVYPKVSGLAAWSKNCKWYSSLPLGAVVSLFCESVY